MTEPRIEFEPESHVYSVDGAVKRSVTQVLNDAGISDYSNVPDDILWDAQQRGTMVHRAAHFINQHNLDPDTVDERIAGYIEAYHAFRRDHELKVRRSEFIVHRRITILDQEVIVPAASDLTIIGTVDIEGTVLKQGQVVADLKTGDETEAWAPQLAAYVRALSATARHTHKRLNVQLMRSGKYRLVWHRMRDFDRDWGVFRNALIQVQHAG